MQTSSHEKASPVDEVVSTANEKNSMDISLFPKVEVSNVFSLQKRSSFSQIHLRYVTLISWELLI